MTRVERVERVHRTRASGARRRRDRDRMPKPPSGWQRPSRRIASHAAAHGAVHLDGLARVLRARRDVAARRRSVGGQLLVEADQAEDRHGRPSCSRASLRMEVAHDRAERVAELAIRGRAAAAGRRRRGTRGPARAPRPRRGTTARRRRRTRLRATAPPTRRPTAYATRGGPSVPDRCAGHGRGLLDGGAGPAASARNDARSRTGQIRPTGGSGPWTGGDAITARPAGVRIRSRKPCFFFRLRLFGWNVLFTHGLLERPGRGCREVGPGAARATAVRSDAARGRWTVAVYGSTGGRRGNPARSGSRPAGERSTRTPDVASAALWTVPPTRPLVALSTALLSSATPTTGRPRRSGTSPPPARAPGRGRRRPTAPTALLHTCGHTCGQHGESQRGHTSSG